MRDPGVDDHAIEAAPGADDLAECGRHRGWVGHVHGHGRNPRWVALPEFGDEPVECGAGKIGRGDMATGGEQGFADARADGPGSAGDQRDAAAQAVGSVVKSARAQLGLLVRAEFHVEQVLVVERQILGAALVDGRFHGAAPAG